MKALLMICPSPDERVKSFKITVSAEDMTETIPSMSFVDEARLQGTLARDGSLVWLVLEVRSAVNLECRRCLETFRKEVTSQVEQKYKTSDVREDGLLEDEDAMLCEDERVDIVVPMREAMLLALPGYPLCDEGCRGLCPQCGNRFLTDSCECSRETQGFRNTLGDQLSKHISKS